MPVASLENLRTVLTKQTKSVHFGTYLPPIQVLPSYKNRHLLAWEEFPPRLEGEEGLKEKTNVTADKRAAMPGTD